MHTYIYTHTYTYIYNFRPRRTPTHWHTKHLHRAAPQGRAAEASLV